MNWREKTHSELKPHLERTVAHTAKERGAYERAPDPANAQLWIALAQLHKMISDVHVRLQRMEELFSQKKSPQRNIRARSKQ